LDYRAAAREVLREAGHILHYMDITEIVLDSGHLESAGLTPQTTTRARQSPWMFVTTPERSLSGRLPGSTA
jgi:hypothetical protein